MGLTDKAHKLLTEKLRNEDRRYYSETEIKRLFKTDLEVDDLNQLLFDLMKEGRLCRDDDSWLLPRADHESYRAIHEAYRLATDKMPERQSWKDSPGKKLLNGRILKRPKIQPKY